MTERLTTLAAVKDWLDITNDDSDASLTRLIDAASQFVLNWVGWPSFGVREYTVNFRGNGRAYTILNQWPVQSVTSVGIGGSFVSASVAGNAGLPGNGYYVSDRRFGPQQLMLQGYGFWNGAPSQVIYHAGFQTTQVTEIPTTPFQITPNTDGQWIAGIEVEIDGIDAVQVTGTPNTGEYQLDEWGTYTFAAADVGKAATITYDYAPWDVSFAVQELIGEWYKRKDRIGLLSKTLGGQETVTFSQKDMGDSIRSTLQPYVNVVPM